MTSFAFLRTAKRRLLKIISDAMGKPAINDDEDIETEVSLFESEADELSSDLDVPSPYRS